MRIWARGHAGILRGPLLVVGPKRGFRLYAPVPGRHGRGHGTRRPVTQSLSTCFRISGRCTYYLFDGSWTVTREPTVWLLAAMVAGGLLVCVVFAILVVRRRHYWCWLYAASTFAPSRRGCWPRPRLVDSEVVFPNKVRDCTWIAYALDSRVGGSGFPELAHLQS